MTTITHEQFEAFVERVGAGGGPQCVAALHDLGITIAPPEPPEGMVKLAREIAAKEGSWTERYGQEILDGRVDDHYGVKIALAALQFADKVVRKTGEGRGLYTPADACDEIRRKLGAIA